jgi:cytochrome c
LISALVLVACAASQYGATDASMARARAATPRGAELFQSQCAACHGEHGEGVSNTPPILGDDALPEYPRERNLNAGIASGDPEALRLQARARPAGAPWRDPFRTAADLFGYVSQNMPPVRDRKRALDAGDYWAIVNFMLRSQGVALPPAGVTADDAARIEL